MNKLKHSIESHKGSWSEYDKPAVAEKLKRLIELAGYEVVEEDAEKPWGMYFRLSGKQADIFVDEFFPSLSAEDARLGNPEAELSPKILMVAPGQRLSWQYHERRAERWVFLTEGGYNKSETDDPGELNVVQAGHMVQFRQGERHRLVGVSNDYTLVAEIWQHTDIDELSDEADITRLEDDYSR